MKYEREVYDYLIRLIRVEGRGFHPRFNRVYKSVPAWQSAARCSPSDAKMIVGGGKGQKARMVLFLEAVASVKKIKLERAANAPYIVPNAESEMQRRRKILDYRREEIRKLETRKENRKRGAVKAIETRVTNAALRSLPDFLQGLCYSYRRIPCTGCGFDGEFGSGLVWCRDREVKCSVCHGECCLWEKFLDAECVRVAAYMFRTGENFKKIRDAIEEERSGEKSEKFWDGTLSSAWEATGQIDSGEAAAIRAKCGHRHEETNYDELLASGMTKEDARALASYR